ncbi:MAG: hypothetical protein BWX88_04260 [Planctomycetes bacterium ADurb.Bin126]|nr:MAG: hypothetical protein BWX88_04260 [Planctomycetes bacterium ADurb.Bin126]
MGEITSPPVAMAMTLPAPFSIPPWLKTKKPIANTVYNRPSDRPYRSSMISPMVVFSLRRYHGAISQ